MTVGSVSAQELFAPGRISPQLQAKANTTYIVNFDASVDASLVRRNAASIASRFGGRIVHTYEDLVNRVRFCDNAAKTHLKDQEIYDVSDYLNNEFYKFLKIDS